MTRRAKMIQAQFQIGEHVVYPGHGVAQITNIDTKKIMGRPQKFYCLKILEGGTTIMIPQSNAHNVGVRSLINQGEVGQVLNLLKKKTAMKIDNQTWNRRYREYMEKIKTGDIYEVAKVLRDLFLLKTDKELSFGEKKMLDKARKLLIKELALATKTKESDIENKMQKIFSA